MRRLLFVCLLAVGCKQGAGSRCQVQSDCSDGLTCNQTKGTCEQPGTGTPIDATVPPMDVLLPGDAGTDASPDAAPTDAIPLG